MLAVLPLSCSGPGDARRDDVRSATVDPAGTTTEPVRTGSEGTTAAAPIATVAGTTVVPSAAPTAAAAVQAPGAERAARAGADSFVVADPPPSTPVGDGTAVRVTTMTALRTAASRARAGDVITVAPGAYAGGRVVVPADVVGTEAAPVVIRSEEPGAAVLRSCGGATTTSCIRIEGRHVAIVGFTFDKSVGSFAVTLNGSDNRLVGNRFDGAGDGRDGSSAALVFVDGDPGWRGGIMADRPPAPIVERRNRVEGNVFLQPRNVVYYQMHGAAGNVVAGNVIEGPNGIPTGESMAIKVGYGDGPDDVALTIAHNSIRDWGRTEPYTIGVKATGVRILDNHLDRGSIMIRAGDHAEIEGNRIDDGSLLLTGDGHRIAENLIRTIDPAHRFGPLLLHVRGVTTNRFGTFDGVRGAVFQREVTGSTIVGNTFVAVGEQRSVITALSQFTPVADHLVTGNTMRDNLLVRDRNGPFVDGLGGTIVDVARNALVRRNAWAGNRLACSTTPCRTPLDEFGPLDAGNHAGPGGVDLAALIGP
jgi:hypothetical protein